MKKIRPAVEPPENSPVVRVPALHRVAMDTPMNLDGLPENERRYAQSIHKVYIRYWHRRLSKDEAQAWQLFLAYNLLSAPVMKTKFANVKGDHNES